MPAKHTSRLAAVVATVFTSLIAPTVVSLVTNSIKAEDPTRALHDPAPRASATVISWPPPAPTVLLLPPRIDLSPSTAHRASFLAEP